MPRGSLNHEPDKSTTLYTHFKTWSWSLTTMKVVRTGGGEGSLIEAIQVCTPQKVGLLGIFGLKTLRSF